MDLLHHRDRDPDDALHISSPSPAPAMPSATSDPLHQQPYHASPGFHAQPSTDPAVDVASPFAQSYPAHPSPSPQFGPQLTPLDLVDIADPPNSLTERALRSLDVPSDQSINPAFLSNTLDPLILDTSLNQHVDTVNSMAAAVHSHSPTPPHMMQTLPSATASSHASPAMSRATFTPAHSRNQSLDPSTAYTMAQNDAAMAFRGHRRTPSDTRSDVSSVHSPYTNDLVDVKDDPSPLLNAQQDPALFENVLQFGQFTLNENQAHVSPGHSPHISPQLTPQQQALPAFAPSSFGLGPTITTQFDQQGFALFPGQPQEPFPSMGHGPGPDLGQADTMSPPEINIDFAPPSRQASFEPAKAGCQIDALSPPDRTRNRNRLRAKSDPFSSASSRASTPSDAHRSLSPSAAKASRSPSPSYKSSRRSSTSSIPHRDYILDLADPSRPSSQQSGDSGAKRTQKHPATFQCSLCPKRFTRAYNLRSHLRTHTDERPFVCNVCGKAFARQHDRKRHESLHSGEKKFVCRGVLKSSSNWGCGRRFARADALGRHFRSEAGRMCIRPLLEEEAREKGGWQAPNAADGSNAMFGDPMAGQGFGGMMAAPQSGFDSFAPNASGAASSMAAASAYALPAALLAQYPALAGIQWDQLPAGPDDMEGDLSGRSSFDASSAGELLEEDQEPDFKQTAFGGAGWTSDYESGVQ